jgi:cell division septum initiation protein DivIVA
VDLKAYTRLVNDCARLRRENAELRERLEREANQRDGATTAPAKYEPEPDEGE